MGFGAGHVVDMMNRMKQNRAQQPSKRTKFKENNKNYSTDIKNKGLNFKTVSEEELAEIKKRIRERAETDRKKQWIIYGIFIVSGIISLIGFLMWLN